MMALEPGRTGIPHPLGELQLVVWQLQAVADLLLCECEDMRMTRRNHLCFLLRAIAEKGQQALNDAHPAIGEP